MNKSKKPGKVASPFEPPDHPPKGAPMQETLRWAIQVLSVAKRTAAPGSPRAKVVESLDRFMSKAIMLLDRVDSGERPLRAVADMLEMRDLARLEQQWISEWIAYESLDQPVLDAVQIYKIQLARLESTAMVSVAFVGTDREADKDTGGWWSRAAGKAVVDVISLGPTLLWIPEDSDEYLAWKATLK